MNYKTKKRPLVHFVAIGGVGISALARWFLAKNWRISGSDAAPSKITAELKKEGINVKFSHRRGNVGPEVTMVIYSSAVSERNPELQEARRRGITPLSYPRTLGCLTEVYTTVAIAGSHGKSTTTALTALALIGAGFDPTVVVGTMLEELGGKNFRHGKGNLLVIEADEWNRSFHHYHPDIAVVLNIDREHVDTYATLTESKKAFLQYLGRTKPSGTFVLNRDDKNLWSLRSRIARLAKSDRRKVVWFSMKRDPLARRIARVLQIPGAHNISNALAAAQVARLMEVPEGIILKSLHAYQGAWRRMEYRGEMKMENGKWKMPVYDDYAHHPTEIRATLRAFREKFPGRALVCVYQPHQAKRLRALYRDFVTAFRDADCLILLPTYDVLGRDTKSARYTSETLARNIAKDNPTANVLYLKNPQHIRAALMGVLETIRYTRHPARHPLHPIVVMMGAGDIVQHTEKLLK